MTKNWTLISHNTVDLLCTPMEETHSTAGVLQQHRVRAACHSICSKTMKRMGGTLAGTSITREAVAAVATAQA